MKAQNVDRRRRCSTLTQLEDRDQAQAQALPEGTTIPGHQGRARSAGSARAISRARASGPRAPSTGPPARRSPSSSDAIACTAGAAWGQRHAGSAAHGTPPGRARDVVRVLTERAMHAFGVHRRRQRSVRNGKPVDVHGRRWQGATRCRTSGGACARPSMRGVRAHGPGRRPLAFLDGSARSTTDGPLYVAIPGRGVPSTTRPTWTLSVVDRPRRRLVRVPVRRAGARARAARLASAARHDRGQATSARRSRSRATAPPSAAGAASSVER